MDEEKWAGEGPVHGKRKEKEGGKRTHGTGSRKQNKVGTGSGYKNEGHNKDVPGMRGQEGGDTMKGTGRGTEMKEILRKGQEGGDRKEETGRRGQDKGTGNGYRNEGNKKEEPGRRGRNEGNNKEEPGRAGKEGQEGRDRMKGIGMGTGMKETMRNGQEGGDMKEVAGRRG
jgi:hypothetical protein